MGIIDNSFNNSGEGEQNIGQGDGAIGKQENIKQDVRGNRNIVLGTGDAYVEQHYHDAPPSVVPRQLPPLDTCFLGRDEEVTKLLKQLEPGKVTAVCGPGGMGKSALAAQAVSKLEADRFPDGIVFHSFYHQPSTDMALQTICNAFQVEAKAGLADTVRQVLADKKVLLILDGAEEADDLKGVLVLRSTCGVLITSRKRADAQGFRLDLKPLEKLPAAAVFCEHSGAAADDESVQGICKILDGWPVGLRIAGRYCSSTGESAAGYLHWLEQEPFKELGDGEHQEENAALLLRRSVAQVSEDARLALGVAGTLAFAPIAREPVAAILEDDERRVRKALGELVNYGLLETREERWQVSHRLVHTYTRTELALSREKLERLAWRYVLVYKAASSAGLPGYAFLDRERLHCLQLMESCLECGLWKYVKALVGVIWNYLDLQGYWTEQLVAVKMSLNAAQKDGDRSNKAQCLNNLGYIYERRGDYDKGLMWFKQSLLIWIKLEDKAWEGIILNNIGNIYRKQERNNHAFQYLKRSLSIREEVGDREGQSITLNNIGMIYDNQGDYTTALEKYEQCLPIWRKLKNKKGEGISLNNIGMIYRNLGNKTKALTSLKQALKIRCDLVDRVGEAESLWNIGLTYKDMGDLALAEKHITLAVQIAVQIDHPALEQFRDGLKQVLAERQDMKEA